MEFKWSLRSVCSEFSASGRLAPWLLVPCAVAWSSSCTPPIQKERKTTQTDRSPFWVLRAIKPGWESLHGVVSLSFAWLGCVKSPRRQQTRGFPISLRQISCPTFARSDPGRSLIISPFFRPTKLPAYPGSPTPGAPVWTSPPASAQTAGSTFLQLPSLKAEERDFSSFHSFGVIVATRPVVIWKNHKPT